MSRWSPASSNTELGSSRPNPASAGADKSSTEMSLTQGKVPSSRVSTDTEVSLIGFSNFILYRSKKDDVYLQVSGVWLSLSAWVNPGAAVTSEQANGFKQLLDLVFICSPPTHPPQNI